MNKFAVATVGCILHFATTFCHTAFCSPLSVRSPDGTYEFRLENHADGSGTYQLIQGGKPIWSKPGGNRDVLVAAWSADSRRLIFVEEDKISLEVISLDEGHVSATRVDEKRLLETGASLITYDWNATHEGSIPHDLVVEMKPLGEDSFAGLYLRAKYPKRVVVPFKLKLPADGRGFGQALYEIGQPLFLKMWADPIPTLNEVLAKNGERGQATNPD